MSDLRLRLRLPLVAAVAGLSLLAGCGGQGADLDGSHPDYGKALAGSPPPLASLHKQANELLPGGKEAYERRIASLRGFPIVVNVWASWCGPCRFEFPAFQRFSAQYGKRVAFLGLNSQDSNDTASTFLRGAPVPYPSYTDPDEEITDSLGGRKGLPKTAFYDTEGELIYLKQGQYADEADLRADIERYALAEPAGKGG